MEIVLKQDNQLLSIEQMAGALGWKPQRLQYYIRHKSQKPPMTIQGTHILFDAALVFAWSKTIVDGRKKKTSLAAGEL